MKCLGKLISSCEYSRLQQGYYDLNYPPASLGAGRDNLGSVTYSAMNDGRFARTDNNSSPVGNVSLKL